jgi:chromosomal replication initiation ATPase DnaA
MKQEIFKQYVEIVSERFGISEDDVFTKTKRMECVDARHMLYYLCSKRQMRIKTIQDYMAQRGYHISHSSIIYGINQMDEKVKADRDYLSVINSIHESVNIH